MRVNNAMYETLGHTWWNEDAGFEITSLRYAMEPVRYGYFKARLAQLAAPGRRVLDIGCGGGFLAEDFARDGYDVTGIDPAANSIAAAREHAAAHGLAIEYRVGRGESLAFPDSAFDIAACCDVLEHVEDPAQVVREAARVLAGGGVFLFDTVNRTFRSWLGLIKIWQDWNVAGFSQPNAHAWEQFITPKELTHMLGRAGLAPGPLRGIAPAKRPAALLRTIWRIRKGRIGGEGLATEFAMRETDDLSVSYMGFAVKTT